MTSHLTLDQLAERFLLISLPTAAAAAFEVVGLTWQQARRLAHGAQIPLGELGGPGGTAVLGAPAPAMTAAVLSDVAPGEALAAFAPGGTLVALVTVESARLRSLAVFTTPEELGHDLGE